MEESQPISESNNNNTHEDDDHDDDVVIVDDLSSSVDTSRPFTSVKEAVAIFGKRLLAGDYLLYSPKPSIVSSSDTTNTIPIQRDPSWRISSPSSSTLMKSKNEEREEEEAQNGGNNNNNNNDAVIETLRKLKAELEKTKAELKLLKERGSETEVALATLNAELHKNMSKLAHAEAVAAGKAAAATTTKTVRFEINETNKKNCDDDDIIKEGEEEEKKKKKEYINITRMNNDSSRTLAHILSLGENDHILFGGGKDNNNKLQKMKRKSIMKKHKPIIPLVGDILFFKRKPSSPSHQYNPPL